MNIRATAICPLCGARLNFAAVPAAGSLLPCLICTDPLVTRPSFDPWAAERGQMQTAPPVLIPVELASVADLMGAGERGRVMLGRAQAEIRARRPFGTWHVNAQAGGAYIQAL